MAASISYELLKNGHRRAYAKIGPCDIGIQDDT